MRPPARCPTASSSNPATASSKSATGSHDRRRARVGEVRFANRGKQRKPDWPRTNPQERQTLNCCPDKPTCKLHPSRRSPSRPPFRPERRPVRFLGRLGDCQNRLGSVSSGSIQRIAQTALWLRSSRAAPDRRSLCPRWAGLNGTGTTGTGGDWHRTARKRRNTAKWTGGATEQTSVSGRDPGSSKLSHG